MIFATPPFATLDPKERSLYLKLRFTLWAGMFGLGSVVLFSFLFPTITTSFDFQNPKSSRNLIFEPRSIDGTPRVNGKVELGGVLIANTSILGDFSDATVALRLEKDSGIPGSVNVKLRKSYRAFLFPDGPPVAAFPDAKVYRMNDTYYLLRDDTLHPFVSEAAFLTRFPKERAVHESSEFLSRYPVAQDFVGFRVGSLLSFADGVFLVTSETDIRPVGSAEIFLALGYRFEDVRPVSEEDIGIYKRGRIFLLGIPHPDGTLFRDTDSKTLYVIENGARRPILDPAYAAFLADEQTPIGMSHSASLETARCTAAPGLLADRLECTAALTKLEQSTGSDYEITLEGQSAPFELRTLSFALDTRMNKDNVLTLLSKIKQRLFARFGLITS